MSDADNSSITKEELSLGKWYGLLPGLAMASIIAGASLYLGKITILINDVITAIVIGAVVRNFIGIQGIFKPGLSFILKKILRLAIILLGMQISFQQVVNTGSRSLVIILFIVIIAIPLTYFIGKKLGLNQEISTLLGVGSAICGATAVLAAGPAIKAKERDIALAVGTIFVFNTLALILYPVIGNLAHMSNITYGTWTGLAVQDVSSVVATGFAFSPEAGQMATVVKLTRTVFIVPVVFLVGVIFNLKDQEQARRADKKVDYLKIFPWFVLGFLLMAMINSMGIFTESFRNAFNPITHFLILAVMASVGSGLDFKEMKKVGLTFLYVGLAGMLIMSVLSLALIKLLGIGY